MSRSTKQLRLIPGVERQVLELSGELSGEDLSGELPFGSVGRQMNKMLEQMNKGYFGFHPVETWTPAVNLYETAEQYLVCVDLAGVDKDKIDITVQGNRLTFRGTRVVPTLPPVEGRDGDAPSEDSSQQHRVRVHLMEIDHGSFSRDVELPEDVQADQINAIYRNGLLWIELPKN